MQDGADRTYLSPTEITESSCKGIWGRHILGFTFTGVSNQGFTLGQNWADLAGMRRSSATL
jgi:hypothetical protein